MIASTAWTRFAWAARTGLRRFLGNVDDRQRLDSFHVGFVLAPRLMPPPWTCGDAP